MKISKIILALAVLFLGVCVAAEKDDPDSGMTVIGDAAPYGNFDWPLEDCEVNASLKDNIYKCAMFLKIADDPKKVFISYYAERNIEKAENQPEISLDDKVVYESAKESIKCDFSKVTGNALRRFSLFTKTPVVMEKGFMYTATVYLKAGEPDYNLKASLMGKSKIEGVIKEAGIHNFTNKAASNFWQPVEINLTLNHNAKIESGEFNRIAIDIVKPGIFWIGKVVISKRPLKPNEKIVYGKY